MLNVLDVQNLSINVIGESSDIDDAGKESRRTTKKGRNDFREISGDQSVETAILGKDSAALTITLPASQLSEELYCYCNRISFGKVSS